MNYIDRQGTDKKAQRNIKKERKQNKQKIGIGTQALLTSKIELSNCLSETV